MQAHTEVTQIAHAPDACALFAHLAQGFAVSVEPGANIAARFPDSGPYDERLGYAQIPKFLNALKERGYLVERQARLSPICLCVCACDSVGQCQTGSLTFCRPMNVFKSLVVNSLNMFV